MTNEELLTQLRQIVREEVKAETEPIKKDMVTLKRDMATRQDIQLLEQAIEKEAKTMGEFFHETWARMETTNERVTNIEEHVGLSHRN